MAEVVAFFVASAIVAIATIWGGYVLSIIWGWFMVPTFGLPLLSVTAAMGVALVIGYLTHAYKEPDSETHPWKRMFYVFMRPLVVLVFGWIVKQWMPT